MTSASELFYNRRSRTGRNDTELGLGSSIDRNLHYSRRRNQQQQRRGVDDFDPFRRSPHVRHLCHREQESVRLDYGTSQSGTGNSGSTESSSSRANRLRFARNDRLPGAVLLARERLLERLRGVSLTGNRQSSRLSSSVSLDEFTFSDDFRLVDAGDWETETAREWLVGGTPFTDSAIQTDLLSSLQDTSTKKPPGLSPEEANWLHREVFSEKEKYAGVRLGVEQDCSICLERFQEGDGIICLPCRHRFHSACLDPWVRTCGDCPYCRTGIIVAHHRTGQKTSSNPHRNSDVLVP